MVSSTCFEHPSDHPQKDLYTQFYGISVTYPYKQSGRWQDVLVIVTLVESSWNVMAHGDAREGKLANGVSSQYSSHYLGT